MKKAFFVLLFALLATAVFGQTYPEIRTPYGVWRCPGVFYEGKNKGQELIAGKTRVEMLSNDQLNLVRAALNYYQHSRGDTFSLWLDYWPNYWSAFYPQTQIIVLVEYTTSTDWVYWAYVLMKW
jgi:hypothetical protein